MIELIIKNWLDQKLKEPVYLEEPIKPPKEFVLVEKTSSGERNKLKSVTIAIQSYGDSLYHAATLNEQVKLVMDEITGLNEVASVKLNTDYNYTDTETKRYRYQAIYDLKYY